MLGTTHIQVGTLLATTTCLVTNKTEPKEIGIALGLSYIGSLIADIDATESKFKYIYKKIVTSLIITIVLACGYCYWQKIDIMQQLQVIKDVIQQNQTYLGFVLLFLLCTIGYFTPHRSFTHWLISAFLFSYPMYLIVGNNVIYFFIGMVGHQVIDFLNKKPIKWLFPLPIDFARYKIEADHPKSKRIGHICLFLAIIELVYIFFIR